MPPDPLILSFDTSAAHCAVALLSGDQILETRVETMSKGQAERLIPLLQEVLAAQGFGWDDLAAIAVGTGPGNFTGIRISVSAARGLALGLGIPAIGVSQFDAVSLDLGAPSPHWVLVAGPRDTLYAQRMDATATPPRVVIRDDLQRLDAPQHHRADSPDTAIVEAMARIGRRRMTAATAQAAPAPLYIRPADAALPSEPPPVILDDA